MTRNEHDGFVKEAFAGAAMAGLRKLAPKMMSGAAAASKATAKSVPLTGAPIKKAKSPMLRAGGLLAAGGAAGAVGGALVMSAAQKQKPMAPGSLAREKRRQQADRHGNY